MGDNMEVISDPCPVCGYKSLFIGSGGFLTCSNLKCPNPVTGDAIKLIKEEARTWRWIVAMAMYRMDLNEVSLPGWPAGVETNLGELDRQVEKLIRAEWAKLSNEERAALLRNVGRAALLNMQNEREGKVEA